MIPPQREEDPDGEDEAEADGVAEGVDHRPSASGKIFRLDSEWGWN